MHRGGVQRAVSGFEKAPGNREGEKSHPHTKRNRLENQRRCLSQNVQGVGSPGRWSAHLEASWSHRRNGREG